MTSVLLGGAIALLLFAVLAYGGVETWSNALCVMGAGALGAGAAFRGRPRYSLAPGTATGLPALAVCCTMAALGILLALQLAPLGADAVRRLSPGSALIYGPSAPVGEVWSLSVYREGTLLAAARIGAFALFFLAILRALDSRRQVLRLAAALSLLGFALALFGIVQNVTWNGRIFWIGSPAASPFGPFVNKNHFAGLMTLIMPVTVGLFLGSSRILPSNRQVDRHRLEGRKVLRIAVQGSIAATMFLATLMSLSRGGAVSLCLAVAVIGVPVLLGRRRRPREWFTTLLLTLVAIAALWLGVGGGFERVRTLFFLPDDRSFATRLLMWEDMLAMVRDFPVFGSGFGTFTQAFLPYRTFGSGSHVVIYGHNDHLQLLAEGGLAALLIVGTGCAVFLLSTRQALRHRLDTEAVYLVQGGIVGLTAFIFHSLSTFNFRIPANALAFAAVAALTIGALRSRRSPGSP